MFQWRSKRHFPMDAAPSGFPKGSSQPPTPDEPNFPRHDSARPVQQYSSSSLQSGVKAFTKVAIGKGAKFRPGTRDGSSGAPSPMSFAAGPRSSTRRGSSLEFGGGVVPDDSYSEADQSDSSASPITPQHSASTDSKQSKSVVVHARASSPSPSRFNRRQQDPAPVDHTRLHSISTLGSLEDFRSVIAFSSPTNLLDESPALTTSTAMSTPDFAAAVAANRDKPLPILNPDESQSSFAASSSRTKPVPHVRSLSPATNAAADALQFARKSHRTVTAKSGQASTDESRAPGSLSNASQRRSTASSLPETISQPGSSQNQSEEFQGAGQRASTTELMRRLEESVRRGTDTATAFGLGISGASDDNHASPASTSKAADSHRHSSRSPRRHTKTISEASAQSSADSCGRTSFSRDALRMLIDSDPLDGSKKPASSASSITRRTYVSDSDYSIGTAETGTDIQDSDHLSTIKEHTESPASLLPRRISPDSGVSRLQKAEWSDAGTSSAMSDGCRAASSPELHVARIEGRMPHAAEFHDYRLPTAPVQTVVSGLGSPTFGLRQTKLSQPAAVTDLLPPLDLEASADKSHTRRSSNASSTKSRKPPSERSFVAGPRRGSAEPLTAPLPSLPFPTSPTASLSRADPARSTAHASEPNTPNLAYEALLAKTVGKQRKSRPAALALNLATLSTFPPSPSALSANNFTAKGLASPAKLRAPPPPSAPPTDPLPPIPDTPSFAPKSPGLQKRNGSRAAPASSSTDVAGDDQVDPLTTPKLSRTFSSSRDDQADGHPSTLSPSSAAAKTNAPLAERVSSAIDSSKQSEAAAQANKPSSDDIVSRSSVVSAASEARSTSSATVTSAGESSDGTTTVAVAQTARRTASQPVRLSITKKDRDVQEAIKTAASTVVATEHAGGQIVSPGTRSAIVKEYSRSTVAKADTETPRSPASSGQIISFDLPPQRRTFEPQQQQSVRTAVHDKFPGPPPSAWNSRSAASVSRRDAIMGDTRASSSDTDHERQKDPRGGAESVASCHSTMSSISNRRLETLHDKEALLGVLSESSRKEILKRSEGRFTGAFAEVAQAFRQLQADKSLLEQIVREKMPLSGVGANNEMLSGYLSTMNSKLEQSNSEIRKLLDLLEQQREVMEQMMATHQLEKETYEDDLERLYSALDEAQAEAEHHRAHVVKLNEELAQAHANTVQANAEAMRARTTLAEEGRKREKVVMLLRAAKERLREVETENLVSPGSRQTVGRHEDSEVERLSADSLDASSESEVARLRRLLEERDQEIASLRLSHADALVQQQQQQDAADDAASNADGSVLERELAIEAVDSADVEAAPSAQELARLRAQILEQKEREKQIRTAYVYVREELRKVNLERKRSSVGSIQSLTGTVTPSSTVTGGGVTATTSRATSPWNTLSAVATRTSRYHDMRAPMSAGVDADAAAGQQQVKLKRLSLPIVARASGILVPSPGVGAPSGPSDSVQQQQLLLLKGRTGTAPPSAYRPPASPESGT